MKVNSGLNPNNRAIDSFMMEEDDDKPQPGRRVDGRFTKGNTISKGRVNPIAASVYELKSAMLAATTPERVRECTERLLALCRDADGRIALQALELLFNRIFGKPKESLELDVNASSTINPSLLPDGKLQAIVAILDQQDQQDQTPALITHASPVHLGVPENGPAAVPVKVRVDQPEGR